MVGPRHLNPHAEAYLTLQDLLPRSLADCIRATGTVVRADLCVYGLVVYREAGKILKRV